MMVEGRFLDLITGQAFAFYDPQKSVQMPARCLELEDLIQWERDIVESPKPERKARSNDPQGKLF